MSPKCQHVLCSQCKLIESSLTVQQLFYCIKKEILATIGPGYLEYSCIPSDTGYQVAKSLFFDSQVEQLSVQLSYDSVIHILSIKMPTEFHNAHVSWATHEFGLGFPNGFLTLNKSDDIDFSCDSSFDSFLTLYQNTFKQPNDYFKPTGAAILTIIFETEYLESYQYLLADQNLWFNGTTGINVVILLKWSLINNKTSVKDYIEIWHRGILTCQKFDIFPAPPSGTPSQMVTLYRKDFYPLDAVSAGRNPNDMWLWSMDCLQKVVQGNQRL